MTSHQRDNTTMNNDWMGKTVGGWTVSILNVLLWLEYFHTSYRDHREQVC